MKPPALAAALLLAAVLAAGAYVVLHEAAPRGAPALPQYSYAELTGSLFAAAPPDPTRAPRVRALDPPGFPNASSIWGATGRDFRGHIWVGVSAANAGMSAHLFEYDPDEDRWTDHGAVTERLRDAGLGRAGEGQVKIHSKIVPANDGKLYFASSDEDGEAPDSGALPRAGAHLWRIDPRAGTWEHLLAAREGLVAVSGVGRYIYALGYWGHVLYQYDTVEGTTRRTEVGSLAGHVSRNFLADLRGHAFVPRVRAGAGGQPVAELVEFDPALQEIGATPLEHYFGAGAPGASHGIVALAYLHDGRMLFTTHAGALYAIDTDGAGPASVRPLGGMHPEPGGYPASLFALGGEWIGGAVQRGERFDWVVRELSSGLASATPLDTGGLRKVLLYGSVARDNAGRAYLVGWAERDAGGGQRPLVLQLEP